MLVYLVRHAIAQEHAVSDSARELTAEGVAQAHSLAEKFRQYAPAMDRVLCSPYSRAQQTAACLMPLFPGLEITSDAGLEPTGELYAMLDSIESYDVQHLMLVGHNPFLSNLLSLLADGTLESRRYVDNATLHCLSLDVVAPGCAEILYTLTP